MKAVDNGVIEKQLGWRYATKKFDPTRKISAADWKTLEASLVESPSSFGLQPWKFVVVSSPAVREKLTAAAWGQSQVKDASHLVVIAARRGMTTADVDKLIDRTAEVRHAPVAALAEYKGMMTGFVSARSPAELDAWCARQTYIALGFLLETAAMLEVDACPMEGFNPGDFDKILGLEGTGYTAVVMATLGYRAADDKYAGMPKVRYATDELIHRVD